MEFKDPEIPIIGNCTGQPLTTAESVKQELVAQICSCVQWKDSVDYIVGSGVDSFLEIGPGRALNGMVKRISRGATTVNVGDIDSILELHKN